MQSAVLKTLDQIGYSKIAAVAGLIVLKSCAPEPAFSADEELLAILEGRDAKLTQTRSFDDAGASKSKLNWDALNKKPAVEQNNRENPDHRWFFEAKDGVEKRVKSLPIVAEIANNPDVDIDIWDLRLKYNATAGLNDLFEKQLGIGALGDNQSVNVTIAYDQDDVIDSYGSQDGSVIRVGYDYKF